jgi:hypothetical protein
MLVVDFSSERMVKVIFAQWREKGIRLSLSLSFFNSMIPCTVLAKQGQACSEFYSIYLPHLRF